MEGEASVARRRSVLSLPRREPRVFVLDQPRGGNYDVSDAGRFGRITRIEQPGDGAFYNDVALAMVKRAMRDFNRDDYIVAGIGHPLSLFWVAAIAARRTGGNLKLLYWSRRNNEYSAFNINVYDS